MVQYNLLPLKKWHVKLGVFLNSIIPGWSGMHPVQATASVQCMSWSGRDGWDRAMPAWPQARQGMAAGNNFLWKAWYQTTFSSSTPLKLLGLE